MISSIFEVNNGEYKMNKLSFSILASLLLFLCGCGTKKYNIVVKNKVPVKFNNPMIYFNIDDKNDVTITFEEFPGS